MRFAVPVVGGMISPHFGHCEQFAFIDVDEATKTVVQKQFVPSPGHQPGMLPIWLAEQGVSAILAGGIGSRAQALFYENRINVIVGVVESDPETAVLKYLNGSLTTVDNVCDH